MNNLPQENKEIYKRFASSDEEAERRSKIYKSKDPFPDIPYALLNSADIMDYIAATGMLYPFHIESEREYFKSASYGVRLLGPCICWDEKGKKHEETIDLKKEFPLAKNSIVFVSLEPIFRIPDYIALRFNLTIKDVHKGLLLGTGPLVDPGFKGKLLIPLHNLTENDYILRGGEVLIWIEFTKISPNDRWDSHKSNKHQEKPERQGKYIPFPKDKREITDPNDYLYNANSGRPIRSSIPGVLEETRKLAQKTQKKLNIITWGGIASIIAIIISITFPTCRLVMDTTKYIRNSKEQYTQMYDQQSKEIESLKKEVQDLKEKPKNYPKQSAYEPAKSESESKNLQKEGTKSNN